MGFHLRRLKILLLKKLMFELTSLLDADPFSEGYNFFLAAIVTAI
jgi:hypothetical protein